MLKKPEGELIYSILRGRFKPRSAIYRAFLSRIEKIMAEIPLGAGVVVTIAGVVCAIFPYVSSRTGRMNIPVGYENDEKIEISLKGSPRVFRASVASGYFIAVITIVLGLALICASIL
jgi:hypothetical protein